MSDPYDGFRDGLGRFLSGNPGGGRKYSWLSGSEFYRRYGLLVASPGRCPVCGCVEYRFNMRFDGVNVFVIRCKCNGCDFERIYDSYSEKWSSI